MESREDERRRKMMQEIVNAKEMDRAGLEKVYGKVWDTQELAVEFEVLGFLAPFVMVRRRKNGEKGTMMFQHGPRFYWGFQKE